MSYGRSILLVLLVLGLLGSLPLAGAQGFPCVVRGIVYYNGIPVDGADVISSSGGADTSHDGGNYGVDVTSGTLNVSVTATYNSHSATISGIDTPSDGGFVYRNVSINASGESATATGGLPSVENPASPTSSPASIWPAVAAFLVVACLIKSGGQKAK